MKFIYFEDVIVCFISLLLILLFNTAFILSEEISANVHQMNSVQHLYFMLFLPICKYNLQFLKKIAQLTFAVTILLVNKILFFSILKSIPFKNQQTSVTKQLIIYAPSCFIITLMLHKIQEIIKIFPKYEVLYLLSLLNISVSWYH